MVDDYFELRNKKIVELVEGKKMNISKYIKYINKHPKNKTIVLQRIKKRNQ